MAGVIVAWVTVAGVTVAVGDSDGGDNGRG